jgi:hypothetical protein
MARQYIRLEGSKKQSQDYSASVNNSFFYAKNCLTGSCFSHENIQNFVISDQITSDDLGQ